MLMVDERERAELAAARERQPSQFAVDGMDDGELAGGDVVDLADGILAKAIALRQARFF
jgi:hypothetical protein